MISEEEYRVLKNKVESLKMEREQKLGALRQIEETLKKEFNCNTIDQAKELLKKLKQKQRRQERKFHKRLESFKKEYEEYLEQVRKADKH